MADETTSKRHKIDPNAGVKFTSDNQPPPEAKKAGWKQLREQRLLTQNLLKMLLDENGIPTTDGTSFFQSLLNNAKGGNPKAIDVLVNSLEDQVTKTDITTNGSEIPAQIVIVNSVPEMKELEG
jgi:hypothetical protein